VNQKLGNGPLVQGHVNGWKKTRKSRRKRSRTGVRNYLNRSQEKGATDRLIADWGCDLPENTTKFESFGIVGGYCQRRKRKTEKR